MFFALLTTVISETATYFAIYRKEEYKDLKANIES